jgi:hypothetical protein
MGALRRYNESMTITIEQLPPAVDRALNEKATREGRTIEEVAAEAIAKGLGVESGKQPVRDLSDIVGTMTDEDARAIEESVRWTDAADLASRK